MTTTPLIIRYGDNAVLYGQADTLATYGTEPSPAPTPDEQATEVSIVAHNLLTVHLSPPLRLWTGDRDANIIGEDYQGGLASLNLRGSVFSVSEGNLYSEGTISLTLPSPNRSDYPTEITDDEFNKGQELRQLLLNYDGNHYAELSTVWTINRGLTWNLIPSWIRGRLSGPRLSGNEYEVDVVNPDIEAYRPPQLVWSHEYQIERYDGLDLGFEFARDIAEGVVPAQFPNPIDKPQIAAVATDGASANIPNPSGGDRDGQGEPESEFPGDDPDTDPGPQ